MEIERGIRDAVTVLRTQQQLEHDQQIPTTSQKIETQIPQPSATLESKMLQVLSNVQSSPLTAHERRIIHLFLRAVPPRLLRMLLELWSELGCSLHQKSFLAWRQFSDTERTGLLHVAEEMLKPLVHLSPEDHRDALDALIWALIGSSLKETIQSSLEDFLQAWEEASEEEHSQSVNEFIKSWSNEGSAEQLAEGIQELIQEIRDEDSSVELVEDTLQEWKDALDSRANIGLQPFGKYPGK